MTSIEIVAQRLRALADEFTQHWPIPGGIVIAVSRDETLLELPFGLANIDARQPVTRDHLFAIGSISKGFVGLALLQLAEEGKVDLDAPVTTYLPWFSVRSDHPMFTLRHLLNHSAGLPAGTDALPDEIGQGWWLRELSTGFAPGSSFHYSNIGYILLGLVVTAVTGRPTVEAYKERLLEPFGMAASASCISNKDRHRFAVGYAPAADDYPWIPGSALAPATWFETNTSDGNIAATGPDLARFVRMLLGEGRLDGKPVISPKAFEQLTGLQAPGGEPIVEFLADTGVERSVYGLGINAETIRGGRCLTHGGGMVGYATFVLADLSRDVGIVVLTNANGDCPGAQVIARAAHAWLTGHEIELPPIGLDLDVHDQLAFQPAMLGDFFVYDAVGHPVAVSFAVDEGKVMLSSGGVRGHVFKTWSSRYATDHPAFATFHLTFEQGIDGGEGGWNCGPLELRRKPNASAGGGKASRACVGHYRSHSPWYTNFRIVSRGGRLLLIAPGGVEAPGDDLELVELEPGVFRVGAATHAPERLVLGPVVNDKVVSVTRDGNRYSRTFTD
ncbi:MAG TPA: serine hydrolase domain-containing protein [Mesorhizobium sp.]|jgi:CubicO group peptidase (beta-lactamase class C family)|uniref:serine hydrolase domain-containing protein n=1 Tax=Mesorhizobium sp. TaxID=1871066 RepID=UPI002DDC9C3A|nr:serine hydrolase domain-containing protein [Mesorhizobium sp.]HEV2501747.1 serine hydrolase domain-containing protein [Mesorhizobium sp.]